MHAPFLGLKVNSFLLRLQQKNEGKGQGQLWQSDILLRKMADCQS